MKTQEVSKRGIPDVMGSLCGQFFVIELKDDGEEPDDLQFHVLQNIADSGAIAMVCEPSNWKESYVILQKLARQYASERKSKGILQ